VVDVADDNAVSIVALSDDLTGTMGLAILIANENIPVRALASVNDRYDASEDRGRAVVINTETRAVDEQSARKTITDLVRQFPPSTIIAKRFDTTLRGHLGAELAAIMEQRPQAAAIVVSSYPDSGRLCIGGYQQLRGVPIERTEVATDPGWPITNSYVPDYFAQAGEVTFIPLNEVTAGDVPLEARLVSVLKPGAVAVLDAYSDADIATIARATQAVETELIYVAPGVFIGAALGLLYQRTSHRLTVVANGSTTLQTREQVGVLEQKYVVRYLDIPIDVIAAGTSETFIRDFLAKWDSSEADVLVVRPEWARADRALQPRIVHAIAEIVACVVENLSCEIAGLILSGGETATAVLNRLETRSIAPEVEFGSLIMGGVMLDGALAGTKIVTKGGLVGDRSIFLKTLTWFLKENNS
jgi:uncharacterized protein YgbK (DUF1537 family)